MYNCNYLYYMFYVATISKNVRFYNIYFLGQVNESVCLVSLSVSI